MIQKFLGSILHDMDVYESIIRDNFKKVLKNF